MRISDWSSDVCSSDLLIDTLLDRHADILEEHLVHLMLAAERDDRPYRDAGRFHVDQQEGDALLRLCLLVGADEEETPIGVLRHRRPRLLPVDDIMIALAPPDGAEDCQVRTRPRTPTGQATPLPPPPRARPGR